MGPGAKVPNDTAWSTNANLHNLPTWEYGLSCGYYWGWVAESTSKRAAAFNSRSLTSEIVQHISECISIFNWDCNGLRVLLRRLDRERPWNDHGSTKCLLSFKKLDLLIHFKLFYILTSSHAWSSGLLVMLLWQIQGDRMRYVWLYDWTTLKFIRDYCGINCKPILNIIWICLPTASPSPSSSTPALYVGIVLCTSMQVLIIITIIRAAGRAAAVQQCRRRVSHTEWLLP